MSVARSWDGVGHRELAFSVRNFTEISGVERGVSSVAWSLRNGRRPHRVGSIWLCEVREVVGEVESEWALSKSSPRATCIDEGGSDRWHGVFQIKPREFYISVDASHVASSRSRG